MIRCKLSKKNRVVNRLTVTFAIQTQLHNMLNKALIVPHFINVKTSEASVLKAYNELALPMLNEGDRV